ncbi:hypothetical protein CIG75_17480 [Tumebacillus algifaecis]|uniref:Uncharacterized protein n=1 Tax=Tumebacillus algifaecis TaxID=1214604 RepID=A0A223D536_9BACL|nr:hypothetical protein [Tumebacillus algifaecis]ASS76577.1 hypothetical protein CIG75_17480 [Tumebacillus algifaecis]
MVQVANYQAAKDIQQGQLVGKVTTDTTWDNAASTTCNTWVNPTEGGCFIWSKDHPASMHCATYKTFNINTTKPLISATLFLAVDNYGSVFINGKTVTVDDPTPEPSNYKQGRYFIFSKEDCEQYFVAGQNIITILAYNYAPTGDTTDNPAGVYTSLEVFA